MANYIGQEPIHIQSYLGNVDEISKYPSDINSPAVKMGMHTPLHFACYGHAKRDAVEQLVGAGADIGARDIRRRTPFHLAINAARPDIVDFVLSLEDSAGLLLDRDDNGRTAFHALFIPGSEHKSFEDIIICANQYLEKLRTSGIALESILNLRDSNGFTPAMLAKKYYGDTFSELFMKYSQDLSTLVGVSPAGPYDLDYYDRTPLHTAAFVNNTQEVMRILNSDEGVTPNLFQSNPSMGGRNPVHYAAAGISTIGLLDFLLAHPSIEGQLTSPLMDDFYGGGLLHHAAAGGKFEIVNAVLSHKEVRLTELSGNSYLEKEDIHGLTALHAALMSSTRVEDRIQSVAALLSYGLSITKEDKQGRNAEQIAEIHGTSEILTRARQIADARKFGQEAASLPEEEVEEVTEKPSIKNPQKKFTPS